MIYKNIFVDGIMHMGDMIMTAAVFPVLRKHCPEARITYLCSANLAFVAELLEGVDEVIPYSYTSGGMGMCGRLVGSWPSAILTWGFLWIHGNG